MTPEAWIAVITAFFGGGGIAGVTGYLQNRYKDRHRGKLDERQQVFNQQIGIVERLEARLDKSEEEHRLAIAEVVKDLRECREHHVSCERDMAFIKGQMHELSKLVRNVQGPLVEVHGPGELRTIETTSQTAVFEPDDSTRMPREDK